MGKYRTTDVAENLGKFLLVRSVHPRGKIEVTLTVKMETRHPEGVPFGRKFTAFVIIAEL